MIVMKKKFLLSLLVVGVLLNDPSLANDKPLKVFIFAGQSNMVGTGANVSDLPEDLKGEQKMAFFFDGIKWGVLAPGKTEKRGFGPEISFSRKISTEIKEPIGIVKYSVAGTNLAQHWLPANPESLYAKLLKKVSAAQQMRKTEMIGMIWMQGESDSFDKNMAEAYSKNLSDFIQTTRKDLKSPEMFFVAGRVNPPKDRFPFVVIVRYAQEKCTVPGYAFVDCDPLEKMRDRLHYNTRGLVDMGYRFADAMLMLMQKK
jgi:hypothetical protein